MKSFFHGVIIVLSLLHLTISFSFGQSFSEELYDPLGKPAVWADLLKAPKDTTLWAEYMGISWSKLPPISLEQVTSWQQQINKQNEAEAALNAKKEDDFNSDEFWGEVSDDTEILEEVVIGASKEEIKYYAELKKTATKETKQVATEKVNIFENFIVIEDLFEEEYKALGYKYTRYEILYPNEEYDKVKWVEEKEKELKQLKENAYNDGKLDYLTRKKQ